MFGSEVLIKLQIPVHFISLQLISGIIHRHQRVVRKGTRAMKRCFPTGHVLCKFKMHLRVLAAEEDMILFHQFGFILIECSNSRSYSPIPGES